MREILAVSVISLSVFLSSAAFAEGEKDLAKSNQKNIKACQQKVTVLEKKIEDLQASSQNKKVVIFAGKEKGASIDSSSSWLEIWEEEAYDD